MSAKKNISNPYPDGILFDSEHDLYSDAKEAKKQEPKVKAPKVKAPKATKKKGK